MGGGWGSVKCMGSSAVLLRRAGVGNMQTGDNKAFERGYLSVLGLAMVMLYVVSLLRLGA